VFKKPAPSSTTPPPPFLGRKNRRNESIMKVPDGAGFFYGVKKLPPQTT
jgi:hypothetical protein